MSGGGGGPSQTTVNQSNIPDWLRPQVETLLGGATKQLFQTKEIPGVDGAPSTYEITGTRPFTPYSTRMEDYVADFSPLGKQVQANVGNLEIPGQFAQGTRFADAAGQGGLGSAQRAYGYGQAGFQSGQLGQALGITGGQQYGAQGADIGLMGLRAEELGRDITGQARGYAQQAAGMGDLYGQMATSPGVYQQYMSPYQQAVTDLQIQAAQRQADIARQGRRSMAARSGAYGGARQAIEEAEANRALQSQLANIQAQGLQQAYQQAQANIQQRAQLGLQGLSGAQQGLGTALQGGQLGLSGIGQALAGQQLGLQGVQAQLAGTAQGMQGAQAGLQGVSGAQAGYGLANQAAGTLGQLGTQQNQAQLGILEFQNKIAQQQQAQEQAKINQAIQNYAQAQEAPITALNQYNALLRGYAVPGQTTTQYQAAPSVASQAAGLGLAGVGLANLSKKKGGKIDSGEGIDKIAMRRALAGV